MNVCGTAPFLALVLGGLGVAACSSSSSGKTPDAHVDAGDAQVPDGGDADDASDAQAPDGGDAAWHTDSTGFQLVESGGGLVPAADVYLCTGELRTWRYDVATRAVDLTGCSQGQLLTGHAVLSSGAATRLTALLASLRVKAPGTGCGADAPDLALSVFGPGSSSLQYVSDFYAGCSSFDAGSAAFLAFDALNPLIALLQSDLQGCADGGSPAEAGVDCTPLAIEDASAE